MKALSITDENLIDCDCLEKDTDLEHTLGDEEDLNIVQLNIRGLISKQTSLIQETLSKNPYKNLHLHFM